MFELKNIYKLKYDYDFLNPVLSTSQLQQHYTGHLLKYYEKLNKLVSNLNLQEVSSNLITLIKYSFGKQQLLNVFLNAGQIINHIYYFESFVLSDMPADTIKKIKSHFVDKDNLTEKILSTVDTFCQGSTWLWVVINNHGEIKVFVTPNAFTIHNLDFVATVLCCIDVWEHAYYLDYKDNRDEYITKILTKTNLYALIN
jgi:Fe-Mn family superoxide dismutase